MSVEAIRKGSRVRRNGRALRQGMKARSGCVMNELGGGMVTVLWDGLKGRERWTTDLLELDESISALPPPDAKEQP